MSDSSVNRNNTPDSSSVLRASRRRKIDTVDNSNETAFWASDRGTASQSTLPPTIGTPITDRSQHHRRYTQGGGGTEGLQRNDNVRFGRRGNKELSERPPDPATMAPHSSGALFPPWGAGRGAETRAGASHEAAAGAPKWWREGGSRAPPAERARFLGGTEQNDFGSGRGVEWDPYPGVSYGDEDDDEQEPSAGRLLESRGGVYKSAPRSKRRMSRSKRSRAVKGSSTEARRRPGTGLAGGRARDDTMGGRTNGLS